MFLRLGHVHAHVTPPHSSLPEKVLVPSTRDSQNNQTARTTPYTYAILHRQEPTTSANRSKSCPRDPSSRPVTAPKTHFSVQSKPNIQVYPQSSCSQLNPSEIASPSTVSYASCDSRSSSTASYWCKFQVFLYSCFQV